ncbi:MAG: class I SAM-dependent methyltransferase [Oscillospiraceae bacterium]|nr:class I SAM-dependent methyltransferase [Oscillospiraceae bacterium]
MIVKYEAPLAAAYVRGTAHMSGKPTLSSELAQTPLEALTDSELTQIINAGLQAGMNMYHFKKKDDLPRVSAVIGFLRGVQPQSLLDVGSGRGAFLFPFLREFPDVPVTSVDLLPRRAEMLRTVSAGGIDHLTALQHDICAWNAPDGAFDVVTLLEVLEHIPNVERAVANAVRLARRYVVVTVPSKPDNNPEHIHLLTKEKLTGLFTAAGCEKLKFGGVNGHLLAITSVNQPKERDRDV